MEDIFLRQCKRSKSLKWRKHESGGVSFSNPFIVFYEGRTYRQPEVVFISLPQAATGLRFACRARSVGGAFSQTICASNEPSGHTCMSIWRLPQQPANLFAGSWRPACAAGRTLRGALRADLLMPQEALLRRGRY